jgi:hypothetical protein
MSAHKDGSEIGASIEQEGLTFLRQARRVRDLDPARVERIARRLRKPAARSRRLWPALVAAGLALVAGATLAVAQNGLSGLPIVGALFSPKPKTAPAEPRRARALPRRSDVAPSGEHTAPAALPPAEPSVAPLPTTTPSATSAELPLALHPHQTTTPALPRSEQLERVALRDGRRDVGDREHTRPAETPSRSESTEEPIVEESRAFAEVIESWRRQRDAGRSLVLLEAYERSYPTGHMRLEARLLRAEIYLAEGHRDAALSVLDSMSLAGLPRARELKTVRGELRVEAGHCREARADLGNVLEVSMTDALARRATRALAHCP